MPFFQGVECVLYTLVTLPTNPGNIIVRKEGNRYVCV